MPSKSISLSTPATVLGAGSRKCVSLHLPSDAAAEIWVDSSGPANFSDATGRLDQIEPTAAMAPGLGFCLKPGQTAILSGGAVNNPIQAASEGEVSVTLIVTEFRSDFEIGSVGGESASIVAGLSNWTENGNGDLVPNAAGKKILLNDGSPSAPAIGFFSDEDIGIHFENSAIVFDIAGLRQWAVTGGGNLQGGNLTYIGFSPNSNPLTTPDARLYREGPRHLGIRDGANPCALSVYNDYTDGSNYERGVFRFVGNVLEIGAEAGSGGGVGRNVNFLFEDHITFSRRVGGFDWKLSNAGFSPDNANRSIPVGSNSKRWSSAFLGNNLTESAASSALDVDSIWNTTGSPILIKANVANTASGVGALLMGLQVGGANRFAVDLAGSIGLHGVTPPDQADHLADPAADTASLAAWASSINSILESYGLKAAS